MAAQVPDSLTIDGRRWAIEDWAGDHGCVATNENIGIETVSRATDNWADHSLIGPRSSVATRLGTRHPLPVRGQLAPGLPDRSVRRAARESARHGDLLRPEIDKPDVFVREIVCVRAVRRIDTTLGVSKTRWRAVSFSLAGKAAPGPEACAR